jgi:hypothetical protein
MVSSGKKTLYVVNSLAKTGSTTFFELLIAQGVSVARTHSYNNNFELFNCQDFVDTIVSRQVFEESVMKQFDEIKMIGMFRNPIARRISQYLHSISQEVILNTIIANVAITCPIAKQAVLHYLSTGNEYTIDEVVSDFMLFFKDSDPSEYIFFIECIESLIGGAKIDIESVRNGLWIHECIYLGKPMSILLFKLENLITVAGDVLNYLGIAENMQVGCKLDKTKFNHLIKEKDIRKVVQAIYTSTAQWEPHVMLMEHSLIKDLGYA